MAMNKLNADQRESKLDNNGPARTTVIEHKGSDASSGLQAGYSEYDHFSAPQFTEKHRGGQYPEAVDGHQDPRSFPELSPGVGGYQNRQYTQGNHLELAPPHPPQNGKKRRIIIIAAIVFAVVIAAAAGALGGYFGSKNSNHNDNAKDSSTTFTSTPQSPSSDTPGGDSGSTDGSSGSSPTRNGGKPSDALNGTAMATVAYDAAQKYSADTTAENYLLFYQHSNGDIRKLVYNQSEWHGSEFVTSDARIGTGLSVVQFGAIPTAIYMYYIDKSGYLQELRSTHGSNEWTNGTLGTGHFKAVDTYSALSANYIGDCGDRGNIGWVYYESEEGIQEALWAHDQDTWDKGTLFTDHAPGSEFWSTHDTSPITAWRMYSLTKDRHIQEHYCSDCCNNATTEWTTGLNATTVDNSTLGLAGIMVNGSRIVYYQDSQSDKIMELNNTDFPTGSKGNYNEAWVTNPSTRGSGTGAVNVGGSASTASGNSTSAQAILGSKLSMAQGFQGLTRKLFLFYQTNGSDITWRSRSEYDIGHWTDPTALDVGM